MLYISAIANKSFIWNNQLEYCKQTWLKTLELSDMLYFITGKYNENMFIYNYDTFLKTNKKIINNEIEYDIVDNFCEIKNKEFINKNKLKFNATYKTLLDMNNFLETNLQYYVRTHTGSYLNLKVLNQLCKKMPNKNCYYGHIWNRDKEYKKYKFCTGSCFVLSRDIVEKICSNIKFVLELYHKTPLIDDVFFGNLLINFYKITPQSLPIVFVRDINNFKFDKNIHHYYFKNKQKCIQENWYQIIHNKFENKNDH